MKDSRELALRELEYAQSLAIQLLYELNTARAQLRTLEPGEDGRMLVCPSGALALCTAVESAHRACRGVEASQV